MALPERQGLYDPRNEHDSCGIGFVANIKGRKSHDIIARGLQILVNLDHRGAVGADPLVGDGAGCLIQMPDALLRDWAASAAAGPAAARPLCGGDVLSAARRGGARFRDPAYRAFHPGRGAGAARLARRADRHRRGSGGRVIETMPSIAQAIVGADPTIADQDAFERKILTIRKQVLNRVVALAERHGSAGAARLLHPVILDAARSSTRGCCWRRRSAASTTICATR